ncbi:MAG: tRNA (N6-isopentenyl adenosine(37)-C2)-methylthiotransferase MiaB [Dehalococcoidia bacterium]
MLRYFIWTIGCQMNKAESQRIASYLNSAGYEAADSFSGADLVVLNTCVVRQSAEDKALGTLGLVKGLKDRHPDLRVLVTGCLVDSDNEGLEQRFPYIDLLFKPGDYGELIAWCRGPGAYVEQIPPGRPLPAHRAFACPDDGWAPASPCAFVPIIQGCDNFCSYCIVPYRRGREVSRPLEDIVREVGLQAGRGTREVTLLGQNVDSYGHDLPGHPDLADLLNGLSTVEGLARIRFLTNHPKDMNLRLIDAMASLDKVCEHLELPVQAGDNDILKAMRRGYSVEQYRELVGAIRSRIPQVSLSTDVIVGFPGETEDQFQRSLRLVREVRFDVVHSAAYSPRPGTIAWREYRDDVPQEVKKSRLNRLEQLQATIAGEINARLWGQEVEVLVEGRKNGKWFGRTRGNKLVFFEHAGNWLGQLAAVRIGRTSPWSLGGEVTQ